MATLKVIHFTYYEIQTFHIRNCIFIAYLLHIPIYEWYLEEIFLPQTVISFINIINLHFTWSQEWYDRLDDILMCSVCLDVTKSKILQCSRGHIFCPFCKGKLQLCPLCQSGFIETRNIVAENIIDCVESMKVSWT